MWGASSTWSAASWSGAPLRLCLMLATPLSPFGVLLRMLGLGEVGVGGHLIAFPATSRAVPNRSIMFRLLGGLRMRMMLMLLLLPTAVFPGGGGRGRGRAGGGEGRLVERRRGVALLGVPCAALPPAPAVLLVGVQGEVGVVARMGMVVVLLLLLLKVAAVLQRGEVCAAIAVVVGVRRPPDLTLLLAPPGGALVLVAEAVSSTVTPLLLMGSHSGATIGEATVVSPATHERLMVRPTGLSAHGWRCLVG